MREEKRKINQGGEEEEDTLRRKINQGRGMWKGNSRRRRRGR